MECREFFETNAENDKICKALQDLPLDVLLTWESLSASEHSPGPVENDENLVRYWHNPIHYDQSTGLLTPTAVDDVASHGLSVNREEHLALAQILQQAKERVERINQKALGKPVRSMAGHSTFSALEIREFLAGLPVARRALAVYDVAEKDDKSHAVICQIVSNKQDARSVRSQLRELANGRLKLV